MTLRGKDNESFKALVIESERAVCLLDFDEGIRSIVPSECRPESRLELFTQLLLAGKSRESAEG